MTKKGDRESTRSQLRKQLIQTPQHLPVLLDARDVLRALDIKPGQLNYLVDQGQLDECSWSGPRRLFRKAQVRQLLIAPAAV